MTIRFDYQNMQYEEVLLDGKTEKIYVPFTMLTGMLLDKTSIYDIAATTFQPLMLREHFRCVPEIISFSNRLSYDFKIKPLRDGSNSLLVPAVVNYRVENGERVGKTNPNEAKTVVALLQACIEQPEYEGKSFGIISLLGDEQVKKLQEEIFNRIDAKVCSERRILCGNASNFQGDERDVIFLSIVDCANGNGPMYAAEIVLELKAEYPFITLECAIPCETQAAKWSEPLRDRYYRIAELCDKETMLQTHYTPDCMKKRNRYMVDQCDILLAVWDEKPSGTGSTVRYAQTQEKSIWIVNPNTLEVQHSGCD